MHQTNRSSRIHYLLTCFQEIFNSWITWQKRENSSSYMKITTRYLSFIGLLEMMKDTNKSFNQMRNLYLTY